MQETHNIRIETTLKDRIRINGERNGNAWTKQMRLDLESLYAVDPYKASPFGEPAYITSLRLLAESLGLSTYELCSLLASLVTTIRGCNVQGVTASPSLPSVPQHIASHVAPPAVMQEAPQNIPVDTTLPPPVPAPWMNEGIPAQGGSLEKFKAAPLKFDASTGEMG